MSLTIVETAQRLKEGKITAVELAKKYLAKIKEKDAKLNSYITVCEETALAQAELSDKRRAEGKERGILDGVPIAIKDIIVTKGILTTAGSKILENFVPPYDATVVKKLKKAGAVILGKTNLDEFAMGSSTENSFYGPTKNPWDLKRVPGGSSGGSAVAVAADLAVGALGSDTGGSIRQPASLCGIVGFKPTYGAVSRFGLIAMASSLDQIGPMTKTVEDAEILFGVIAGYDKKDATSQGSKVKKSLSKNRKIKLGLPKEYFIRGIEKGTEKIILESVKKLEKAGFAIEKISLPHTEYALAVYYIVMPAEVSSNLARFDGIRSVSYTHLTLPTKA